MVPLLKESDLFSSKSLGNLHGRVSVLLCGRCYLCANGEGRDALPDSYRSPVEPPLLVRLPKLSLLLQTLSLSVWKSVSVWNVLAVRSLLAGAALRILVRTPRLLLVVSRMNCRTPKYSVSA
jgi:hypothetical protein